MHFYCGFVAFVGKLGIDLERKFVIDTDRDKDMWRSTYVDPQDVREARKFASPERQVQAGL